MLKAMGMPYDIIGYEVWVTKCTVSGSRVFKVISIFRGDELCFVSRSRAPR
jgi:hypothetical protein